MKRYVLLAAVIGVLGAGSVVSADPLLFDHFTSTATLGGSGSTWSIARNEGLIWIDPTGDGFLRTETGHHHRVSSNMLFLPGAEEVLVASASLQFESGPGGENYQGFGFVQYLESSGIPGLAGGQLSFFFSTYDDRYGDMTGRVRAIVSRNNVEVANYLFEGVPWNLLNTLSIAWTPTGVSFLVPGQESFTFLFPEADAGYFTTPLPLSLISDRPQPYAVDWARVDSTAVPEPATGLLLLAGLAAACVRRRIARRIGGGR